MKSPYVGEMTPNDVITAQFLVINKEIRQKKTGEPYLSLQLADKTGELEAKMWDNVTEVMDTFDRDHFVKVKGLLQIYQKRSQFTIHKLRRLEEHEVDFADYFPCADRDVEEMFAEMRGIISGLKNEHLRSLLTVIFDDPLYATPFKMAPAAKSIHHACRGGLLQHVLSLCTLAKMTAGHYPGVDLDLVLAGAILHDIGKIEELTYARSFGYSSEGQLLGHIVIGLRIISEKVRQVPGFAPKLRTLLEHMIISHHGELEFGSPKVPVFPEALLLHHLDNLDSKMEAMRSALKRDALAEGEFTGWVPSLERTLLRKDRYMAEPAVAVVKETLFAPLPETIPVTGLWGEDKHEGSEFSESRDGQRSPAPSLPHKPEPEVKKVTRPDPVPARATLFGEKLQAVLGPRK